MPLHSVGRKLQTVGGAPLRVGTEPLLNERSIYNFCPPFSTWVLVGGATVDADGVLTLPVLDAKAVSPLMRIDGPDFITLSNQGYSDEPSPFASFNGDAGFLYNASYFAADGVTPAYTNTPTPYSSNGRAAKFTKGVWTPRSYVAGGGYTGWNIQIGPNVVFVRWTIHADVTYSSKPIKFREPMGIRKDNHYEPYAHYYRKGL